MPNPFIKYITTFRISRRECIEPNKSGSSTIYTHDGEIVDGVAGFEKSPKMYDGKRFTKVYNEGWDAFAELSLSAMKVMMFIVKTMGYSDVVHVDVSRCMKETKFRNRENIYRAIKELKEKHFIADCEDGGYYINPSYFYKGDRSKLIKL